MQNFIFLIFLLLLNCVKYNKVYQRTFFKFDTILTITIVDDISEDKFEKISSEITNLANKYDLIFNIYNKNSEVYKISKFQNSKKYKISSQLYNLIKESFKFYNLTDGLFDPTIGIITTRYYKFNQAELELKLDEMKKDLNNVGLNNIELYGSNFIKLKKTPIILDLGGCAKGYIIDRIADYLKSENIKNFLINIGGDIYAKGKNFRNENWQIGIQHPREKNEIIYKIEISDKAVTTSGDYERYIKYKKRKIHHIIDPKTGISIQNNIVSTTIIASNATIADFLSTSIFLLGKEKGIKMLEKNFKDVQYVIIFETNKKLLTESNIPEIKKKFW